MFSPVGRRPLYSAHKFGGELASDDGDPREAALTTAAIAEAAASGAIAALPVGAAAPNQMDQFAFEGQRLPRERPVIV